VLGGGIGAQAAAPRPLDAAASRLASLIVELSELEGELLRRRAAAMGAGGAEFAAADGETLRRAQLMRAALERALRLATKP
jgi:hypothetical protein